MSELISPLAHPEGEVFVSGVGHGTQKGTITIKQNGDTIVLHNLTIVRAPKGKEQIAFERKYVSDQGDSGSREWRDRLLRIHGSIG